MINRDKGQSFLRVFSLLETLASSSVPLGATELSKKTNVPRPSVVRLCAVLAREGLVQHDLKRKRFSLGPRLYRFGIEVVAGSAQKVERHAILQETVAKVGETCNIMIADHTSMAVVDRIESNWTIRAQWEVGMRFPLHCSSSGKLYLSTLPKARRRFLLEKLEIKKYAQNTITDVKALEKNLDKIREQKFSISDQELLDGMVAVAVPITDGRGRFCAALTANGLLPRFPVTFAIEKVPVLQNAAAELRALIEA